MTKIDHNKLRSREARGIFDNHLDGVSWRVRSERLLDEFECARNLPRECLVDVLKLCDGRREEAINTIVDDMVGNGASWAHLAFLAMLVDDEYRSIVPEHHAGKYYSQIADWLLWLDTNLESAG